MPAVRPMKRARIQTVAFISQGNPPCASRYRVRLSKPNLKMYTAVAVLRSAKSGGGHRTFLPQVASKPPDARLCYLQFLRRMPGKEVENVVDEVRREQ